MLVYVYLFLLAFGAVLLAASVVAGGHDHGGSDLHGHADSDGASSHDDGGHGSDATGIPSPLAGLLSLRFWTFFAAFFGLTGAVFDGLDLVEGATLPFVLALGVGIAAGSVTMRVLGALQRSRSGAIPTAQDYVGKVGRVLVALAPGELGKLRLEIGGTTVDVLAKTDEPKLVIGDQALVIDMIDHTAFVTRFQPPTEN